VHNCANRKIRGSGFALSRSNQDTKTPSRATPEEAALLHRNTFKAGKEGKREQSQNPNNTAQYERTGQDTHRKAPDSAIEQRKTPSRLSLASPRRTNPKRYRGS